MVLYSSTGDTIVKLPKHERSEQQIIKEFYPRDREEALSTGRMIIRANNYGSSLVKFDEMYEIMAADALTFEPPIELDREDVEVVHYAGERYKRTFGLEVSIPQGHTIPADYSKIRQPEFLF